MKKFAALFVGMAMMSSAVGCYCGQGGCYTPNYLAPGGGYGGGYGGGCPTGNCGVPLGAAPQGGYYQQGMYQPSYSTVEAGYPGSVVTPVTTGAFAQPYSVPQTAAAPLEPLPPY